MVELPDVLEAAAPDAEVVEGKAAEEIVDAPVAELVEPAVVKEVVDVVEEVAIVLELADPALETVNCPLCARIAFVVGLRKFI